MRLTLASLLALGALAAACAATANRPAPEATPAAKSDRMPTLPVQAADPYFTAAASAVDARAAARGLSPAKNVILFVGDGMGVSTITAARIYAGQSLGIDGESYSLAMDTLPWAGLSRTYSHNFQVSDSAGTATAMTAGVKTRSGVLGVTSEALLGNCATLPGNETESLFALAARAGLSTGVVTTTRITHATPAAAYASTPHRDWESDTNMRGAASDTCRDIARQLIESPVNFDVALGGGRSKFLPTDVPDPEYPDQAGERSDGRNLVREWTEKSPDHRYIFDTAGFNKISFNSDLRILGLFEPGHMQFELDREKDRAGEPSLEDMTRAAITRLSRMKTASS